MRAQGLEASLPTLVRLCLSIRIARLLKLTKYVKKGAAIYDVILVSVPYLVNMVVLMVIFITVYAVVGMNTFPYLKWRSGINTHANFSKFSLAFVALLRVCTGEGWNVLLDDCLRALRPNDICQDIPDFDAFERHGRAFMGCGHNVAYLYFISFVIIFSYVILNLFTGIVIESFYLRARLTSSKVGISQVLGFARKWKEFDKENTGFLPWQEAKLLVNELRPPLGIEPEFKSSSVLNLFFKSLKLPVFRDTEQRTLLVHMYDLALALMKSYLLSEAGYEE